MSDKFAKVPGGCKDVNIVTAAKESKRSKVIVIDLLNFARKPREYYDPKIVLKKDINGGDFIGYKLAWIKLMEKFKKADIEVIFVCDGASIEVSRRRVWADRKYEQMRRDIEPMFNDIE